MLKLKTDQYSFDIAGLSFTFGGTIGTTNTNDFTDIYFMGHPLEKFGDFVQLRSHVQAFLHNHPVNVRIPLDIVQEKVKGPIGAGDVFEIRAFKGHLFLKTVKLPIGKNKTKNVFETTLEIEKITDDLDARKISLSYAEVAALEMGLSKILGAFKNRK